jgi:hypothetical protein
MSRITDYILEEESRGNLIYDTQTSQYLSREDKDNLDRARYDVLVADNYYHKVIDNISLKRYIA